MARVAVDLPLAHLDRVFDYRVPHAMAAGAVPGARVRVRFRNRLVDGFVLERVATSDHQPLQPLARLVSAEPVLAPEIAALCRAVADRWAGTFADVVRLAVPPRHARVEDEAAAAVARAAAAGGDTGPAGEAGDAPGPPLAVAPEPAGWARYDGGAEFLAALADGGAPRAVWRALPGGEWAGELARAAAATLASGRGALLVVPDARDLARLDAALQEVLGPGAHVALAAELGPAERYRRFLAVRRGGVRCVAGTRSAMWAPVRDLGLVACWDDGDDLHKEPRAPYPHARDVLVLRAHLAKAAALVGGYAPSVEAERLVATRWARPLAAARAVVRAVAPAVHVAGSDAELARDPDAGRARLPQVAWRAARAALGAGAPVLVQVPRTGYQPVLACDRCRTPARCRHCGGPLARGAGEDAVPACRWCGRPDASWTCRSCLARALRVAVVGNRRTAEELGRAFPGAVVRTSDGEHMLERVPPGPTIVVATPGAEPTADGGYGAVLLLDGWALLARADLRAGEEALRRWCRAAALARPATSGGAVVLMADGALPPVQALVRWDPAWHARRELDERAALGFPPAVRMAAIDGTPEAVAGLLADATLPDSAEVLGPVPHGDGERALVRVPWRAGNDLARALAAALGVRSARKAPEIARVELDPLAIA